MDTKAENPRIQTWGQPVGKQAERLTTRQVYDDRNERAREDTKDYTQTNTLTGGPKLMRHVLAIRTR